jgi:hypothetical protein
MKRMDEKIKIAVYDENMGVCKVCFDGNRI